MVKVAYRATGGAAQNISMADMVAIRGRIQVDILRGICRRSGGLEAAQEWKRKGMQSKCEELKQM